ncbi:MAG: prepilin-type N-terminal cleavage/methylation domain-containing protein [Acidobacteriota bacterium]
MRPLLQSSRLRIKSQGGFSLIELLIVVAIILIIAAVAVPRMNVQLMAAREMGVIREISSIHNAETQYYSQFGRFASTLAELGPPTGGAPGPAGADLLPSSLTSGKKGGHLFSVALTQNGYAVSVIPEKFGTDGRRTFYSDQTLEIHENWSQEPATVQSPTLGAQAPAAATK